jgi:thiol-disulfide isomerase/thioredoxin
MMKRKSAAIFGVVCCLSFLAPQSIDAASKKSLVGRQAPPMVLTMLDNSKRTLADFAGSVLVINYWATWCVPCKAEMPMMSRFHRKNKSRGFEIIGVITKDSAPPAKLKPLAAALSYPLATDLKGKYGTLKGVPTTYVIDRRGIVRFAEVGSFEDDEFAEIIEPLLRE